MVLWIFYRPAEESSRDLPIPGEVHSLQVEVLNGTTVNGLARTITRKLRRAGIDVVYFGSSQNSERDSTLVLVRRGDSTAADVVRQVLGTGQIRVELDSLLLLDVTVLLGRDLASARGSDP